MVSWIFIVSTVLLATVIVILIRRTDVDSRVVSTLEHRLDIQTLGVIRTSREMVGSVVHFARSDVLLRGLHMVTYVALVSVRFLERQLVRVVQLLRTFRKERTPRSPTHKLARAHEVTESDNEQ